MTRKFFASVLIVWTSACIDPYNPSVISSGLDLLVVDGFINSGVGATRFRLTHTTELNSEDASPLETGASVSIQGDNNTDFILDEVDPGIYQHDQINIDPSARYRVRIITSRNEELLSEYVPVKDTPPIEKVEWEVQPNGAQVYVSSNDPSGNTIYYQWSLEETWHFRSVFCTVMEYRDGEIRLMEPFVDIHNCWKSDDSKGKIIIESTERLTQDRVNRFPLIHLSGNTEKLDVSYSLLVKQNTLTSEAYQYLELLKKNTEQVGSIFDPQPAIVTGNIRNVTNPSKPVLGFVSAYDVEESRIFIHKSDIESYEQFRYFRNDDFCYDQIIVSDLDSASFYRVLTGYYENGYVVPINPPDTVDGVSLPAILSLDTIPFALRRCVDCTLSGSNVKPSFWPALAEDTALGCD